MSTTSPMFLELGQENRERELEQLEQEQRQQQQQVELRNTKQHGTSNESNGLVEQEDHLQGKRVLLAAEKGKLLDLVKIISNNPQVINHSDDDGYTPLHRASYSGHIDCVKYLVRHGANIEARTRDDWTPLHCAVRWNNIIVAEYLISQGANINARSSGNNTPLHIVASNGRYSITGDIIQLLLFNSNCDYEIKNSSGDTAFDIARRSGLFHRFWSGVMTIFPEEQNDQ